MRYGNADAFIRRLTALTLSGALLLPGCGDDSSTNSSAAYEAVELTLRCSGPRYSGGFYRGFLPATDYAVWVEDAAGEHVRTLAVTPTVVSVGEYSHVDHLPAWSTASGIQYTNLQAETTEGVAPSFDSLTRASVLFGEAQADTTLMLTWDLRDAAGQRVDEGSYRLCAEVANIHKDSEDTYQILAESACGEVDLNAGTTTPAEPTEHILALTAQVLEAVE